MNDTTVQILVATLTFLSIVMIGISILISHSQKRKTLETRIHESTANLTETSAFEKKKPDLLNFLAKIGNLTSHGRTSTNLWEELFRAGYYSKATPAIYTGIKMLLFLIGLGGTVILVMPTGSQLTTKVTLIFVGGVVLFFIPNVFLKMRLQKRHDEIYRHLPEAVDLLEICVSSGIGLGMAWNIVADEIQYVCPTLSGAMTLTNFEIHLGVSRIDAMRRMADRTGVDQLSSLAATLVQTERFGTSIAMALKEFAASMREERFYVAEERAEKMAVKLIVPMVLFIFPAVLITVAGPAIITILQMIRQY
jgi:tight adherence protein C